MRTLLLLLAGAAVAQAQTAPPVISEAMRRGREIIDQAVQALGGERFLALETVVERGRMFSFYRQDISGMARATLFTKYAPAPEKPDIGTLYQLERQSFGTMKKKKKEDWSVLFNGEDGWEITYRGARPLSQEDLRNHRTSRQMDIFYVLLRRLNEEGLVFDYRQRVIIDNKPLYEVDITDAKNRVLKVYFHYSSYLPFRQEYEDRDKFGLPHKHLTIYDKFRDAGGGVKLPWVIQRFKDGEKTFSMFAESVEANPKLDAKTFLLPSDIKLLERAE